MSNPDVDITLVTQLAPDSPAEPTQAREGTLTILAGGDVGAVVALTNESYVLGRSPEAGITLDDENCSRNHARIVRSGGHYEIEDLGSTNGTFVGGTKAQGKVRLTDGVRLQLGSTLLRFALQDQIDQEAARRIYEMSVRDGLTGVYNRRYLDERLASEFAFAARHHAPLCVLLCDIDHFKKINDQYGHHAGDEVLRQLAGQLQASLRTEDVLARYGGEEFAVIGRGIDVSGARLFAERVRGIVERLHVLWEDKRIPVTLSIGVAHNHSGGAVTKPETLVAAADNALYAAKRAGRNRVEFAQSPGRYSSSEQEEAAAAAKATLPERPAEKARRSWHAPTARAELKRGATQPVDPAIANKTRTS